LGDTETVCPPKTHLFYYIYDQTRYRVTSETRRTTLPLRQPLHPAWRGTVRHGTVRYGAMRRRFRTADHPTPRGTVQHHIRRPTMPCCQWRRHSTCLPPPTICFLSSDFFVVWSCTKSDSDFVSPPDMMFVFCDSYIR